MDKKHWLKIAGFRQNPFVLHSAEEEEGTVKKYFIKSSIYHLIRGDPRSPRPLVLFAPKGGGKSSHRMMIDHECRNGKMPGRVLSVFHSAFDHIFQQTGKNIFSIRARFHVKEIVQRAVVRFYRRFLYDDEMVDRFCSLSLPDRQQIQQFLSDYNQHLSKGDELAVKGCRYLTRKVDERCIKNNGKSNSLKVLPGNNDLSSPDLLGHFTDILMLLGFEAFYILIDGLESFLRTEQDPNEAFRLIEPLLTNERLLGLPGISFKFFLPRELKPFVLSCKPVRSGELLVNDLTWSGEDLRKILKYRMLTFSMHGHSSLEDVSSSDLKGRLEQEIIELADGSPGELIGIGDRLLFQQCRFLDRNPFADWQISKDAWTRVKEIHFEGKASSKRECSENGNGCDPIFYKPFD